MKVLVFHRRLSGYFISCLFELARHREHELSIVAWPNLKDAPFDASVFQGIGVVRNREELSVDSLRQLAREFEPDCVLLSGWSDKVYVQVCKELKQQGVLVISGCDTQWRGSLRQYVAGWIAPWHVQRFVDVFWVSGERQRQLAEKLGYCGSNCWDGYYACDWKLFSEMGRRRLEIGDGISELEDGRSGMVARDANSGLRSPKSFAFVGRYAPEKGLDTLAEAYRLYSQRVENPWQLVCAGRGSCQQLLLDAGAKDRGFVQPDDLPEFLAEADVFILPSRFEPWGVVVQEAAAAGLPVLVSEVCGASVHLLRDRWNGRSFEAGNSAMLADCLEWFHNRSNNELRELGARSFKLSKQYTPKRWTQTLTEGVEGRRSEAVDQIS